MKFCTDFDVCQKFNFHRSRITEVYKKSSDGHKPLDIDHFRYAIEKLGEEINKDQIKE